MIAVRKCHTLLFAWFTLHSWLGFPRFLDKVLAWLRFTKVYVLKASFNENFLQITDINFLSTIS